jgi:hypothetical protein
MVEPMLESYRATVFGWFIPAIYGHLRDDLEFATYWEVFNQQCISMGHGIG